MPQETNLNIAPYFDDFETDSNYYKVLFKPAFPVQARELNNLQSILQDQVEDVGSHLFKEGSVVIPGGLDYISSYYAIQIEEEYLGIPVNLYLDQLLNQKVTGETSGVTGTVVNYISDSESEKGNYTLYVEYIESSTSDNATATFADNEVLLLTNSISYSSTFIASGEGFAKTLSVDASQTGSAFAMSDGVYFLRGYFVDVAKQLIILDQYSNKPSYRIGLKVQETLVSSDTDPTLNDNSQGFNNHTAPGADRLQIVATLAKKEPDDFNDQNFIQLGEVKDGVLRNLQDTTRYNELGNELARRTFDESGHYYVNEFVISSHESLNNGFGNRGLWNADDTTDQGGTPSEDVGVYRISPGKAYVRGYEVETIAPTLLDFTKPRTTKTLKTQAVNFGFGPTFKVNNAYGSATIGFNNTYTIQLRSERVGADHKVAAGNQIGEARVYDCALETGTMVGSGGTLPATNEWDLSLYDVNPFAEFLLNEPVNLNLPTYVKGANSGASGYLKWAVAAGTGITITDVKGSFNIGEKIEFNGIGNSHRTAIGYTAFSIADAQSVYMINPSSGTGIGTFTADLIPSPVANIGIVSITRCDTTGNGFSTVTTSGTNLSSAFGPSGAWPGICTAGDLVRFSQPGEDLPTLAKIETVNTNNIIISGVTTVPGVIEGKLPLGVGITATNFEIVAPQRKQFRSVGNAAQGDSLYSIFPKKNIESVDLTDATLTIRVQSQTTIGAALSTGTISPETDCVFLPFDEERYTVIRSDGQLESLTEGQLIFESDGSIRFGGLSSADTYTDQTTVITTQRKSKVSAKTKLNKLTASVIIDKSNDIGSGIGGTTLNDGLTYGNFPFGTRVQDSLICMNVPDAVIVYGIFEAGIASTATSGPVAPSAPSCTLGSISGSTATTNDLTPGEELIGQTSDARALYVNRLNDTGINFIYETNTVFESGETVKFSQSGVTAVISDIAITSKNITQNFRFINGQKSTILDYSRIERKEGVPVPARALKIYYEGAVYDNNDTGDITLVNSYDNFNYATQIPSVNGNRVTELIDGRPRVNPYVVTSGSRSPFEFAGRAFNDSQNSSKWVLASDESITVDYSFYLGRMDRIFIDTDGNFIVNYGQPDEIPQLPQEVPGALNIANVGLPPYLYHASQAKISFISYKRYQMSDISKLEQRVKNLEYYTSLNNLENSTINQYVADANGLNRFKSGVLVDDFSSTGMQDSQVGVRNSIDSKNKVLRPSHYTTAVSMDVGNTTMAGIGTTTAANGDARFADIDGNNVKRANQVVMLDYTEESWLRQPFATRTESVTPFLVRFWEGSLSFLPTTDVWIDVNQMQVRNVMAEGSFTGVAQALGAEVRDTADGGRMGVSPVQWRSWETTGVTASMDLNLFETQSSTFAPRPGTIDEFINMHEMGPVNATNHVNDVLGGIAPPNFRVEEETRTTRMNVTGRVGVGLAQQRTGVQNTVNQVIDTSTMGSRVVNRNIIQFMRQRNIQFTGRRLKPFTRVYPFFDGVSVDRFCCSKLAEITMVSGTFQVGETVVGVMPSRVQARETGRALQQSIAFRVANSNHKYGPYNNPTDTFDRNPYDRENRIPASYSETSTILNIDTASLAAEEEPAWSGNLRSGMRLVGRTSGAQATVSNIRLITDRLGTLIGSLEVPNSDNPANPVFQTGRSRLKLSSSSINSTVPGVVTTSAEEVFFSQGDVDNAQQVTLSLRNARVTRRTQTETRNLNASSDRASASMVTDVQRRLTGVYTDPLAQSFAVDDDTGIYVSSVDIYFQTKDTQGLPVTVQIREMKLGIPSDVILEYSEVEKDPDDITVSEDCSAATTFTFESPVYLAGGREYAIIILSGSIEYRVWISRLGESDVQTLATEAGQVLVSSQQLLGSLFKSQNATTWTPSQYEDLTFDLKRAVFESSGSVQFFNPNLPEDKQLLSADPVTPYTNQIRVGLGTTCVDIGTFSINSSGIQTGLVEGNTVIQANSNATGTLIGYGGSATGTLGLINPGVGYTPQGTAAGGANAYYTFTGIALTSVTGNGVNGKVDITITNGVAVAATIVGYTPGSSTPTGQDGGQGYSIGDVVGVASLGNQGLGNLGSGLRFSIANIYGPNEITLNNVQGTFITGVANTLYYETNNVGTSRTELNYFSAGAGGIGGKVAPQSPIESVNDGLHFSVFQRNHGMHATGNVVTLSDFSSSVEPTDLTEAYINTGTGDISLTSTANLLEFEGVGVAVSNPGYIKIGNEILSYTGTSANTLTGVTRGIDNTTAESHEVSDLVYKYEMNGISLRRVNATHNLNEVTKSDPITLDSYTIKVDMSDTNQGTDRSVATHWPPLRFTSGTNCGGFAAKSTYNVPFEMVIPRFNTTTPTGTSIGPSIRTVSGTSIDGSEGSFVDKGFQDLALNQENYFDSPRIVASRINEETYLTTLPGNKSLTVNLNLTSGDNRLSPAIDLDQTSLVCVSNKVNSPITNYATSFKVKQIESDPNRFFYVTKNIELENPATSLQVLIDGYVASTADVRIFYAIDQDGTVDEAIFVPFPGWNNLNPTRPGVVVDSTKSDGSSDRQIQKVDNYQGNPQPGAFTEMKWSKDNLPSFSSFRIKIIGSSTNQAFPPQFKNLRVFALA